MREYKKLVRDKIPEIMIQNGAKPVTRILNDHEYQEELNKKLVEEVDEYIQSKDKEEIADILEVIYAILDYGNISKKEVEEIRVKKREKRGAFQNRVFLERED